MKKFDPLQASLKLVAVGAILTMWGKMTIEVFNFAWHIVSTSPGEETYTGCFKIVCQNCRKLYDDDEEHLITGSFLCEACRLKK